jgi:hypothetical protein
LPSCWANAPPRNDVSDLYPRMTRINANFFSIQFSTIFLALFV